MRKRYRVLVLSALVAAVVVPVGLALSLEPAIQPAVVPSSSSASIALVASVPSPALAVVTGPGLGKPGAPLFPEVPDSVKLFGMGAVLFALAAAVKRALYSNSRHLIAATQTYDRDVSSR